ncbi:MAG: NAD(P)-binding domain-containing protein, partial [Hylemonella sp.]
MSRDVLILGAGKMGLPMARHLQAAGHLVSVSDPDH